MNVRSRNVLRAYSRSSDAFVRANPAIGFTAAGTGTWTFTLTSPTQTSVTTAGGFAGALDIETATLTMDRQDNATMRRHKVVKLATNYLSASGSTELITTLSGGACTMNFDENITFDNSLMF